MILQWHTDDIICLFLDTGATITTAINVLFEHGVKEENIIILTLFCTPEGEKKFKHFTLRFTEP